MEIRNIAIIAHVDHGKTSLTNAILRQTGMAKENVSLDTNALEQERGITIYSKNTAVFYKNTKINILDTPGHADFGSEVERVLRSIDAVLLLVDAAEGPMPQTKFVLKKSLALGLKPILVINKIDKPTANIEKTEEDVFELFLELGANDQQLEFKTIYTIARDGISKMDINDKSQDLTPLLDLILEEVPIASGEKLNSLPLQAQVFNLAYDNFLGRMGICRIYQGTIKNGQTILAKNNKQEILKGRVSKLFNFEGLNRKETNSAQAGDIAMVAGLPNIFIGQTIVDNEKTPSRSAITIDESTLSIFISPNDSPLSGQSGKLLTSMQIKERLQRELEVNVGLRVDFSQSNSKFKVYGRGELHLAVLIENMRREGFELNISQPKVVFKEVNGAKMEPFEEVLITAPEKFSGAIIEKIGQRKGTITNLKNEEGEVKMTIEIPTRGLLGYRSEFIVDTKGEGIMTSTSAGFKPYIGEISKMKIGSMTSMATGKILSYALANLQERGSLYVQPSDPVYEGMIVGQTTSGEEMTVNPTKGKHLTNVRAAAADEAIHLTPPMKLTLEKALGIIQEDEYLEVTPDALRLRKQYLNDIERKRHQRGKS
ncbi:MAG TPA: translational GTPase TypA [Candidatus Portnoybacteria bacterium]|nr:translational GTPase TypA [Candidatus Portnoybacteria bacterium]